MSAVGDLRPTRIGLEGWHIHRTEKYCTYSAISFLPNWRRVRQLYAMVLERNAEAPNMGLFLLTR